MNTTTIKIEDLISPELKRRILQSELKELGVEAREKKEKEKEEKKWK